MLYFNKNIVFGGAFMRKFDIKITDNKIAAIYDKRYSYPFDITDGKGNFANLVYTEKTVDLTKQKRVNNSPYEEKYIEYSENDKGLLINKEYGLSLAISETKHGLLLEQNCDISGLDSSGIFLPLNFMPCKNGTWREQFLISSPYHTKDKKHWLYYFTKPDGKNLALITEDDVVAYKFNYSPFSCGHFIQGFSFLANFDSAYNQERNTAHNIKVHIVPANSYFEALEIACEIWKLPAVYYDCASAKIGTEFNFNLLGAPDKIEIISPDGTTENVDNTSFKPTKYGFYTIVPYKKGKPGADCSLFAYDSIGDVYKRAANYLKGDENDIIGYTSTGLKVWRPPHLSYRGEHDHNLCENCMWAPAVLRNALLFGNNEHFDKLLKNFLLIANPENDSLVIERCSISVEEGYRTKNSTRIQEAYAGVSLFLDAYKLYGNEEYLEFAISILDSRLKQDLLNGAIMRRHNGEEKDYTTVTCMVIPVVDMAVFLKEKNDSRYKIFEDAAIEIADHIANRGMDFPTEGEQPKDYNTEMEEGSMSCSALTVLLVANKIKFKQEYIDFAKGVLQTHDAYTVHTPHPVLFRSSLRWWETIWEGDNNGPAVCFGHAWSIWRAEAQFYYGLLAFDDNRLFDSYNGFMGNYAKVLESGKTHAIYQYESISSGASPEDEYQFYLVEGFPYKSDNSLAHYVFVRDFECWQRTAAILNINGQTRYVGCHLENGEIVFDGIKFEQLYIGDVKGEFTINTQEEIKIISNKLVDVKKASKTVVTVK